MSEVSKNMRFLLLGRSTRFFAYTSLFSSCVAWASLIVGIIGDAVNKKLGLQPSNWFIMAIAFLILAVWEWLKAHAAAKEGL
jgi:putative Ca2+/H+ antiporter (TMEM165/GDT1 family)